MGIANRIFKKLKKLKDKLSTFLVVLGGLQSLHLLSASNGDSLASAHVFKSYTRKWLESNQKYSKEPKFIAKVPTLISNVIKKEEIYISEFVIAKVRGEISTLVGHPKITDETFYKLSQNIIDPIKILHDIRKKSQKVFIFIADDPLLHQIIVEVDRHPSGLTEINSLYDTTNQELKRLEGMLPTVYSSGETPSSRIRAFP